MHAADDVQFRAAGLGRLAAVREQLVASHHVTPGIPALVFATVGAQRAAEDANVGRIDVQIEVVVGDVAILAAANRVGQLAHGVQIDLGREKELAVGRREPLARFDFLANLVERRQSD